METFAVLIISTFFSAFHWPAAAWVGLVFKKIQLSNVAYIYKFDKKYLLIFYIDKM